MKAALPDGRIAAEQAALRAVETELAETISAMTDPGGQTPPPTPGPSAGETAPTAPAEAAPEVEQPRLTVVPPTVEAEALEADSKRTVRIVEPTTPSEPTVPTETAGKGSGTTRSTSRKAKSGGVTEGRTSSSVKVVRSGKAADVFARLRDEGDEEESTPDAADEPVVVEISDDQAWIAGRDESIASLTSSLNRRIKRALSDEQNELLASVGSIKPKQSAIALLPLPEAQIERYEDLALPALADAAAAGAALLASGAKPTHTSVGDLASELASSIVMPLRERIETAMSEAAGDKDDLSRLIRATYRDWKGSRVDDVVDFAVRSACNRGMLERLAKGTKVRWVVAESDEPSPDCEDNALAGAVASGKPFPTGHIVPPLHPGCHCAVMPVGD